MTDHRYLSLPIVDAEKFPGGLELPANEQDQKIKDFRERHWKTALALDFPGNKDENWCWVNFKNFPDVFNREEIKTGLAISYVDEKGSQQDKTPEGVILTDLRTAQAKHVEKWSSLAGTIVGTHGDKFRAMTAALANSGVFISVPKGANLPGKIVIEVNYQAQNSGSAFSHHILNLHENASATVILKLTGNEKPEPSLISSLFEIRLEKGARLNLTEVQALPSQIWYLSHEKAVVAADASLTWNYAALGANTTKNFVTIDLDGEGAEALARGVYFAGKGQHFDLDTQQNHNAKHTTSDLLYKGAANSDGRATWEGMIYVDPIAQQADGFQTNRNLILSDQAEINAIPGLEINADDVKCSHGATVGRLNEDELFYLQSRGIPLDEAQVLVIQGFFAGILDEVLDESTRNYLSRSITEKLLLN